jgi:excisionase family DNA binding protein
MRSNKWRRINMLDGRLSVTQVARRLGVSHDVVVDCIKDGIISAAQTPSGWRVHEKDISSVAAALNHERVADHHMVLRMLGDHHMVLRMLGDMRKTTDEMRDDMARLRCEAIDLAAKIDKLKHIISDGKDAK